jgi:hypothetical protein
MSRTSRGPGSPGSRIGGCASAARCRGPREAGVQVGRGRGADPYAARIIVSRSCRGFPYLIVIADLQLRARIERVRARADLFLFSARGPDACVWHVDSSRKESSSGACAQVSSGLHLVFIRYIPAFDGRRVIGADALKTSPGLRSYDPLLPPRSPSPSLLLIPPLAPLLPLILRLIISCFLYISSVGILMHYTFFRLDWLDHIRHLRHIFRASFQAAASRKGIRRLSIPPPPPRPLTTI